jgi:sec-independent protein translocase protein TatA
MSLPSIGPLELIIILAIALLIVGPKRLPEMGNAFGRTIREFRKATTEASESTSLQSDPAPPATPVTAPPPAPAAPSVITSQPPTAGVDVPEPVRDADDADRPA